MASFRLAVEALWPNEGGYVNHPADPGGPTNLGITLATLRDALGKDLDGDGWVDGDFDHDGDIDADDVRELPRDRAERIYLERYWERPGFGRIADQPLATKVFDFGVNAGPRTAIVLLQRSVNYLVPIGAPRVVDDGILGPATLAAVNASDPELVLRLFSSEQKGFYLRLIANDPEKLAFKNGWLARAEWRPA